jgi:uncharacterized protein (TIGR02285 family)
MCLKVEAIEPIVVDVVTDIVISDPNTEVDMVTRIMVHIGNQLPAQYKLNFIEGSRKREWRQVSESENVCLYNKVNTVERQNMATFSKYPIAAFPANRLVIKKHHVGLLNLLNPLKDAVVNRKLKIGITNGRAYGSYIDEFIKQNMFHFVKGEGQTSAKRQRQMFMKGRIDGVIEYSAVFIDEFPTKKIESEVAFIEIENIAPSIFGYIACSKSESGNKIINELNKIMMAEKTQKFIVLEHQKIFANMQEKQIITKALKAQFNN